MTDYIKGLLSYVSKYLMAMELAGQSRNVFKVLYEPHDGIHHSTEVTVYANPEFTEIMKEGGDSDGEAKEMGEVDRSGTSEDKIGRAHV